MRSAMKPLSALSACCASGARFVFIGHSLRYGLCAPGTQGGDRSLIMLERQPRQMMEQIGCEHVAGLPKHLLPAAER